MFACQEPAPGWTARGEPPRKELSAGQSLGRAGSRCASNRWEQWETCSGARCRLRPLATAAHKSGRSGLGPAGSEENTALQREIQSPEGHQNEEGPGVDRPGPSILESASFLRSAPARRPLENLASPQVLP